MTLILILILERIIFEWYIIAVWNCYVKKFTTNCGKKVAYTGNRRGFIRFRQQ